MGNTKFGTTEFRWGERTYVMGIINMSPDSFSGDGIGKTDFALEQARRFVKEGADILDIGGESTRPGFTPCTAAEEIKRVVPVIEQLTGELSIPISIDTSKSEVALEALKAGAKAVNDVWGLKRAPKIGELAAKYGVPVFLMSNQREKGGFDAKINRDTARYDDVMAEVTAFLKQSVETALKLGVPRENLILDPGIGFGKTWQQDLEIIRRLGELKSLHRPLLVGASRKSFIGKVLDVTADDRKEGDAAVTAIAIANGADMVRVHDVKEMVRVCRMSDALVRQSRSA